ncbi:hypothetical protein N802_11530 [Knoellia sinensis KCTC 19936]|uniref:DUF4386 family protein n=1 Tax=Knoellia sinensis KCTC 19936 TaxID=1385520 RepID=A0A0A0IYZ1_9MICO|nr:hypothetical protein [Knoellia sinensis]KGN29694.1 hypothetical protein N802_11530 [Knoellia sinensis KCTC 19936]
MTTTDHRTSTASSEAAPPRDLRRTWRLIAAIALVAGPLGVTLIRLVMPYWTDDAPAQMVAGFAADPGRGAAMNWISLLVTPLLFLSALAMGYVARRRDPVIATWGAAVLFGAYALGSAVSAPDILVAALLGRGDDQASVAATAQLLMDTPVMLAGALSFVLGHLVGMILVAIAVVRARVVPWWVGVVIAVAQPVHVVSAVVVPSRLLDVVLGWGATTVGYALVARAVLRTPDGEWDLPPIVR